MGSRNENFYLVVKKSDYDAMDGGSSIRNAAIDKWKATLSRGKITRTSNDDIYGIIEQYQVEDVPTELTVSDAIEGASCWTMPTSSTPATRFTHDQISGEYGLTTIDTNWLPEEPV